MNHQKRKLALCAALVALALPLSAADGSSQRISSQQGGQNSQYNERSTQSGTSSNRQQRLSRDCGIIGADAKSKDNQDLGNVEDVLVNPRTGKVDFIVLGQGGVLGIGEDRIPVPWQAATFHSDGTVTVNQEKAKLKSAPSLKKDYSNLNEPYTVTVYEFYAVPVPATGAAESPSGENHGSTHSNNRAGANQ